MTKNTFLKIVNNTPFALTLRVGIDHDNDWASSNRPDNNFQNRRIEKDTEVELQEDLGNTPYAWFTMDATFENNTAASFRCDQYDANRALRRVNQCSKGYLILQEALNGHNRLVIMAYSQWMGDNLDKYRERTLRRICMPGTHDAGMSINVHGGTAHPDSAIITQQMTIGAQLAMGVRYFDLRVIKGSGQFHTGHYTTKDVLFRTIGLGGRGLPFTDIINQINDFTAICNKEVIILTLSHSMDTDDNYGPFNRDMWEGLFNQLKQLQYLYNDQVPDITSVKFKDLVRNGPAVIVVVTENPNDLPRNPAINWGAFPGIHQGSTFPIYDNYANSDNAVQMSKDQLKKMKDNKTNPDSEVFLLSWTLTQTTDDAMASISNPTKNLAYFATYAYQRLNCIFPACTPNSFPNIISVDWIYPDIPVLPLCHDINNLIVPDGGLVDTSGYFLVKNQKRQEDDKPFLDAGESGHPHLGHFADSGYAKWRAEIVASGEPQFKLVNYKHQIPVSAGSDHFLNMQETGNDFTYWTLQYLPSRLYGYRYESPWLHLLNQHFASNGDSRHFMDANAPERTPVLEWQADSPYASWRFDQPLN
eukprot:gene4818-5282_t